MTFSTSQGSVDRCCDTVSTTVFVKQNRRHPRRERVSSPSSYHPSNPGVYTRVVVLPPPYDVRSHTDVSSRPSVVRPRMIFLGQTSSRDYESTLNVHFLDTVTGDSSRGQPVDSETVFTHTSPSLGPSPVVRPHFSLV